MASSSFEKLISSEKPIMIDFYADWCGPCKVVAPILEELKEELGDTVRIIKIDVDKNQAISQKLQVQSIPTMMIYQNGELKWRTAGVQTKALMKKKLEETGWKVYNETDLPILCFNRPDKLVDPKWIHNFVQKLIQKGRMWLSVYPVGDIPCARACISNYNTRKSEIDTIVDLINQELNN